MAKFWENRKNIDLQKPIQPYIFQIIKNTFITSYHQSLRKESLLQKLKTEVIEHLNYTERENTRQEQLQQIEDQIEKLPEKSKVIFNLNKKRGFQYKEISELLNITEKNCRKSYLQSVTAYQDRIKITF